MAATLGSAGDDIVQNPVRELLRRLGITFLLGVVIYRLGIFIPIPGVDYRALHELLTSGGDTSSLAMVIRYANLFNGGAIARASIFGLGIMPYISASIIFQLLAFSMPSLKALQKEGEAGRRKINQYTRYATLALCLIQSLMAAISLLHFHDGGKSLVHTAHTGMFIAQSMVVITTGSMILLWIAEQISKYGIGNGVSVIIMIGILAAVPGAFSSFEDAGIGDYLGVVAISLGIIAGIVVVVQAVRKINLEQQRRIQGNKVYGGAPTTLPLKINQANVIPVIFASPVMVALGFAANKLPGLNEIFGWGSLGYRYIYAALIIAFTFFYISITFDLNDLSNHFKQAGFFVRGIKPGKKTVDFLSYHLTRITFVGAIFLAVVAILPQLLIGSLSLSGRGGMFLLGGTGLLIVVGVSLDVIQKTASFFLAHQYRSGNDGGLGGMGGPRKSGKRF